MGILQGLEDVGWESVRVLVAETAGAESLNASLRAGRLVTLPKISSVARSLGALTVSERFFNKCMELGEPKVCASVCAPCACNSSCDFASVCVCMREEDWKCACVCVCVCGGGGGGKVQSVF
jgi:threonine dehydratase